MFFIFFQKRWAPGALNLYMPVWAAGRRSKVYLTSVDKITSVFFPRRSWPLGKLSCVRNSAKRSSHVSGKDGCEDIGPENPWLFCVKPLEMMIAIPLAKGTLHFSPSFLQEVAKRTMTLHGRLQSEKLGAAPNWSSAICLLAQIFILRKRKSWKPSALHLPERGHGDDVLADAPQPHVLAPISSRGGSSKKVLEVNFPPLLFMRQFEERWHLYWVWHNRRTRPASACRWRPSQAALPGRRFQVKSRGSNVPCLRPALPKRQSHGVVSGTLQPYLYVVGICHPVCHVMGAPTASPIVTKLGQQTLFFAQSRMGP